MAGKQWTKEEHQLLEAFIERDLPYKDIAEQMGRTIHAVELKARKIGLGNRNEISRFRKSRAGNLN